MSLLDAPDEVRGSEIGTLDEGDEVVLLEKRGDVLARPVPGRPRGLAPQDDAGRRRDRGVADRHVDGRRQRADPSATFEDILRAYTEGRRQFGEA